MTLEIIVLILRLFLALICQGHGGGDAANIVAGRLGISAKSVLDIVRGQK